MSLSATFRILAVLGLPDPNSVHLRYDYDSEAKEKKTRRIYEGQ